MSEIKENACCYKKYFGDITSNNYREKYINEYELMQDRFDRFTKIRRIKELENQKSKLISDKYISNIRTFLKSENDSDWIVSMSISITALVVTIVDFLGEKTFDYIIKILVILLAIIALILCAINLHKKMKQKKKDCDLEDKINNF